MPSWAQWPSHRGVDLVMTIIADRSNYNLRGNAYTNIYCTQENH